MVRRFDLLLPGPGDTTTTQLVEAVSSQGFALGQFAIDQNGLYEIKVVSEPAMVSQILQLNVTGDAGAMVTAIAPTVEIESTAINEGSPTTDGTLTPGDIDFNPALSFGVWLAALLVLLD